MIVAVPWKVEEYVKRMGKRPTGRNDEIEAGLKEEFPPGADFGGVPGMVSDPCTVIDTEGNILLWHLPNIVSESAEVSVI